MKLCRTALDRSGVDVCCTAFMFHCIALHHVTFHLIILYDINIDYLNRNTEKLLEFKSNDHFFMYAF